MTRTRYIQNVTTLEELKQEYKRLALLHHPDCGGDTEAMKAINAEYDALFEELKNTHKNRAGEYYTRENTAESAEAWRAVIDSLIRLHMEQVKIEVIGSFLWLSGNTKPYKEAIKRLGFRWSQNKSAWYKSPPGYKKYSGKQYDMNDIRGMYGSTTIKTKGKEDEQQDRGRAALAQ